MIYSGNCVTGFCVIWTFGLKWVTDMSKLPFHHALKETHQNVPMSDLLLSPRLCLFAFENHIFCNHSLIQLKQKCKCNLNLMRNLKLFMLTCFFNAWYPQKGHAYLNKPVGESYRFV